METSDMNMSAANPQPARTIDPPIAKVLRLQKRRPKLSLMRAAAVGRDIAARLVPPVIVIALIALVWEVLCRKQGATLPPPSRVIADTWDLITDPFFDNGGLDKGLFWHLSASLQRVAQGYALASIVGVALGTLVGQSTWAMRGLDPIFQVLRTVPPLAWLPLSLAAFRDGQPSAIFVIFITAIWPIIINTAVGIRNIP
jgi:nitrate/nitrite transport system permease protein